MPLLNYTTRISAERTAAEVMDLLRRHGARSIRTDYDDAGNVSGLQWVSLTKHGPVAFQLPVDAMAVHRVLQRQGVFRRVTVDSQAQAHRVAWRIILNWVEAQMALLETEMVTLDQLMLPYVVNAAGETLYQHMVAGGFNVYALPEGRGE